jgi:hypothetical protein
LGNLEANLRAGRVPPQAYKDRFAVAAGISMFPRAIATFTISITNIGRATSFLFRMGTFIIAFSSGIPAFITGFPSVIGLSVSPLPQ